MTDNTIIFVNKDAVKVDELFFNEDWNIKKMFDRIYSINANGKSLNWLIKTYEKEKYAKKESDTLKKLKNVSGVPRILAANLSENFNYIILSKIPGLDLFEHLEKYGKMTEKTVKPIILKILTIVEKMHDKKIIHKDIKPENIVYDKDTDNIYLIDFEGKHTDDYSSPEQVQQKQLGTKTDIWSVGITLYYLLTKNVPFTSKASILRGKLKFGKKWSDDLQDFFGCLLEREPTLRYTASEAIDHVWFAK